MITHGLIISNFKNISSIRVGVSMHITFVFVLYVQIGVFGDMYCV